METEEEIDITSIKDFIKQYWIVIILILMLCLMFYFYNKDINSCIAYYEDILDGCISLSII